MTQYAKFLAALVGFVVAAAGRRYGVDSQAYTDIVGLLTAVGVYVVPNSDG